VPYTKNRFGFLGELMALENAMISSKVEKGEVTRIITRILVTYIKLKGKKYDFLSDVDGILMTTLFEFHMRVTNHYEAKKQKENDPDNEIYGEITD